MRKVVIATPSLDGRVEATYAYFLAETVRLGMQNGIAFLPLMVLREALIQQARNDLFAMAYKADADDVIWVDSDIAWEPQHALRLLSHDVDVVGGTYRRKDDAESYVVKCRRENLQIGPTGLIEVEALGCGFLRMSRRAVSHLWDVSTAYKSKGDERRWVFDVRPFKGEVVSEDVGACLRLHDDGIPVYLDPAITCHHVGAKTYSGDFASWMARFQMAAAA